jgi:hypothetical protein
VGGVLGRDEGRRGRSSRPGRVHVLTAHLKPCRGGQASASVLTRFETRTQLRCYCFRLKYFLKVFPLQETVITSIAKQEI